MNNTIANGAGVTEISHCSFTHFTALYVKQLSCKMPDGVDRNLFLFSAAKCGNG